MSNSKEIETPKDSVIIVEEKNLSLERSFSNIHNPQVFEKIASEIQSHVNKHGLTANIKGKNYPLVEAWQFAGALIGLFPRLKGTENLSQQKGVYKYKATVEVVNSKTGEVVGVGVAICSNQENLKRYFDEYAILSMAQTRATGKAFRLCIGWLLRASGFESTIAEEMHEKQEGKAPNEMDIWREYRAFALKAISKIDKSVEIVELVKMAKVFENDVDFLEQGREYYTSAFNAGH